MADTATIHERMIAILTQLPPIGKDQRNEQQGFMFRGHDDVLNALNPLLADHGVFIVPDVLERVTDQRTTSKGSIMFEVNLHVRFTFYGAAGDLVTASTWGEGTDMGDKATNKAMTMAFKNVLNQAFAISNKEASDADAESPPETAAKAPGEPAVPRGEKMRVRIQELAVEADRARSVDPGTTWDDLARVLAWRNSEAAGIDIFNVGTGATWDTIDEGVLEWVGQELKRYLDYIGNVPEAEQPMPFDEYVKVPF